RRRNRDHLGQPLEPTSRLALSWTSSPLDSESWNRLGEEMMRLHAGRTRVNREDVRVMNRRESLNEGSAKKARTSCATSVLVRTTPRSPSPRGSVAGHA